MRLLTFDYGGTWRSGLRMDRGILDLLAVHQVAPVADWAPTPAEVLARGIDGLPGLRALVQRANDLPATWIDPVIATLGPCVVAPSKIICIGLNYRRHVAEVKGEVPSAPLLFSKFGNSLIGDGGVVAIPSIAEQVDYEVELAVIIGRRAKSVPAEAAMDHVLGFATANDLSARDLQFRTSQWLLGKSLDGFLPIGPDLVTADEVPDPQSLRLRTWRNGQLCQDSSTADMIFPVVELVAYTSRYMTLEPGDILLTGTPEGVIYGHPDSTWLADGDRVAVEVEGLGRLESVFQAVP